MTVSASRIRGPSVDAAPRLATGSGMPRADNLLSGLASLRRMSRRDQRMFDRRLRVLASEAKSAGAISLAADLLRASYELDTAARS